jgi:hypothetical protein
MSVTLAEIRADANRYLKYTDTTNFTQADRDEMINDAVRKYSQDRPLNIVAALTATSTAWYSLPSDWEEDFSALWEIEYPIEQSPKETIAPEYWDVEYMLISGSTAQRLRFDVNNPSSGDTFWIKYTKRHVFDGSGNSNIPTCHRNAVAYLSVSLMCQALADFFGGKADANLTNVEFIDQPSRVEEWEKLALNWLKKYKLEITQEVNGIHGQIDFSQNMYFDRNQE